MSSPSRVGSRDSRSRSCRRRSRPTTIASPALNAKTKFASLNHPNIASYGIEERDGVTALVMELVDGEDLSAIIASGPSRSPTRSPSPDRSPTRSKRRMKGIMHRDRKPANVKVRDDGTVKVLDFGLAKAMDPAGSSSHAVLFQVRVGFRRSAGADFR